MIIVAIVSTIMLPINFLLNSISGVVIDIPSSFLTVFEKVFANIAYALPIDRLWPILVISFALTNFQITYSIILRIKSLLPGG